MRPRRPEDPQPDRLPDDDEVEIVSVDAVDATGRPLEPAEESGIEEVNIELEESGEGTPGDADDMREGYLRARADLENLRFRVDRERESMALQARVEVIRELLPVLDDLDRALAAPGGEQSIREGLELIARSLHDRLAQLGLEALETKEAVFDPEVHEAGAAEITDEVSPQSIVAELRRGYRLGGRLLRPALVCVALAPEEGPQR